MKRLCLSSRSLAWLLKFGLAVLLGATLAGCTGRGGGWLPPDGVVFSKRATFGFTFSCERSSGSVNPNAPTGRLRIQVSYTDHGSNPLGGPFSIRGQADTLDPVLESMICIGEEPPPGGNELIVLGQYAVTSKPPAGLPAQCAAANADDEQPQCRFEVIVRDNDGSRAPSQGDEFTIRLSSSSALSSALDPGTIVYARSGVLGGGNVQVD
jgi:hypothetical protein